VSFSASPCSERRANDQPQFPSAHYFPKSSFWIAQSFQYVGLVGTWSKRKVRLACFVQGCRSVAIDGWHSDSEQLSTFVFYGSWFLGLRRRYRLYVSIVVWIVINGNNGYSHDSIEVNLMQNASVFLIVGHPPGLSFTISKLHRVATLSLVASFWFLP
jgi:hypothetical protein